MRSGPECQGTGAAPHSAYAGGQIIILQGLHRVIANTASHACCTVGQSAENEDEGAVEEVVSALVADLMVFGYSKHACEVSIAAAVSAPYPSTVIIFIAVLARPLSLAH